MSTFDQKRQNVDTQINVAGNLNIDDKESVIWIKANGSDRFFLKWAKDSLERAVKANSIAPMRPLFRKILDNNDYESLVLEKDFKVIVQDSQQNVVVEEKFNPGDTVKINVKQGKYNVTVQTINDSNRQKFGVLVSNRLSVPLSSSEVVKLDFDCTQRPKLSLKFSV